MSELSSNTAGLDESAAGSDPMPDTSGTGDGSPA